MKAQYAILFTTAAVEHWLDFYGRHLPPEHAEGLYQEWDISLLSLVNQKLGRMECVLDGTGVYPHLPEWFDKLRLEREAPANKSAEEANQDKEPLLSFVSVTVFPRRIFFRFP